MKKVMLKSARTLALSALLLGGVSAMPFANNGQAVAQEAAQEEAKPQWPKRTVPQRPKQRPQIMDPRVGAKLNTALELKDEGDVQGAMEELNEILERRRVSSIARARVYMIMANFYYEADDIPNAIANFEKVLEQEDLLYAVEDQVNNALASLYFMQENYEKSLEYLEKWLVYQEVIPNRAYLLKGQALYAMGRFDEAIPQIETVIERTQFEGGEVKESWWLLLRSMYYDKQDYVKVRDILEILITDWPKATYWLQLAAMYSELQQEDLQLATMEVAYKQGFFDKGTHYVNLAQIYLYNEVPWKAAQVMEDGFGKGLIEETEDNLATFAQAYQMAREDAKAVEPLSRAAEMSEDGELYTRLANVHMNLDQWDKAIPALDKAIAKGGLDRVDQTYLLLGMAHFNVDELTKAQEAFREARRDERSRRQAATWLNFLEKEKQRRDKLAKDMREANRILSENQ